MIRRTVAETRSTEPRVRVLNLARDAGSGVGGAEVLVYEFARRLDPQRFKSYLCTTRAPEPKRREVVARETAVLRGAGVEVLALDRPSSRSLAPWTRLYSLMSRERIDIVHAHMPRASVPGTVLARLARVPVIIAHEHGSVLDGKRVRRFLDRNVVARGSDTLLAVSEWDRRNIIEAEGIPADRVRVFRHGIPAPERGGRDVRPELVGSGSALIGAVGRLVPVKGYEDLIRATGLLKHAGRAIRCVIVGDGPERGRLLELIEELDLSDEVQLLGLRDDVPDLLSALDVAVLSSHSEGGPLAIMEYMAAGVPIVATAAGGIPELIDDGVHGLLVPPRDPARLASAIGRLLDDRALAGALADAALARQQAEYEIDVTVARLESLYLELLGSSRRVRRR